jgi:ribose transport system ATP-binding protein
MPLLAVRSVSKTFPGVQALQDVDIEVNEREVLGLVGENGAGKSTLLDIISRVQTPDSGEVIFSGEPLAGGGYHAASLRGIFRVYQHQALVPNLKVCENMYLSHEKRFSRAGYVRLREMAKAASRVLTESGHGYIDPLAVTSDYDFSTRQVIELVKALALAELLRIDMPLILLDEPTTALSSEQIAFFSSFVGTLRDRASFIFVSHRLNEVTALSDRVYVLRDGQVVAHLDDAGQLREEELHKLMVGRVRNADLYWESRQRVPAERPVLEVTGLSVPPHFDGVDLTLHEGEVLGLAGVIGSGKSELGRALFSANGEREGDVRIHRVAAGGRSPAQTIEQGVGYVPPERLVDGIIGTFSVAWNLALPRQAVAGGLRGLDVARERSDAVRLRKRLGIRAQDIDARCDTLSGGTQQKVVLGKWLALGSSLLILDNPTTGIDVGAKQELYEILRGLAEEGVGVLLISNDLLELIGLSNRIIVMKDGRTVCEFSTPPEAKPAESTILAAMV